MAYIHTVSEMANRSKGTVKIGDTLFVDGTPHIECCICGAIRRKFDAFSGDAHVKVVNGRKQKHLIEYKVMVGYWMREQEVTEDAKGIMTITTKMFPIIHQEPACFQCWSNQQDKKAANPGKAVFYKTTELFRRDK